MFEESGEDPKLAKPVFHLRYWPAWMLEAVALILLGILAVCIPAMDPPVMRVSAASVSWILALSAAVRFLKGQLIPTGVPGIWGAMVSSALAAFVAFALVGWPIPTSTSPVSC